MNPATDGLNRFGIKNWSIEALLEYDDGMSPFELAGPDFDIDRDLPADKVIPDRSQLHAFIEGLGIRSGLSPASSDTLKQLYRATEREDEIRLLEISPGERGSEICARLLHATVGYDHEGVIRSRVDDRAPTAIDRPRFAVSLEDGTPACYTALSYVWGDPIFDHQVVINGIEKKITASLHQAIQHLRQPTRPITLWIDQICINQSSNADKESQVKLMSKIYQRAWNVAVWLGDVEARAAFLAARGIYEATQGRSTTQQELLDEEIEVLRHPKGEMPGAFEQLESLLELPWFTRTWTIQEAILNRQTYLIAGSTWVQWEDFAGECEAAGDLGIFNKRHSGICGEDGEDRPRIYGWESVAGLYKMRLRFQTMQRAEQILSTLVQTRYARVSEPLDKIYGVLGFSFHSVVPDYSISPTELFTRVAYEILDYGFFFYLIHSIDHAPVDSDLPSWAVDWSKPRMTTALGIDSFSHNCFFAGRHSLPEPWQLTVDRATHRVTFRAKLHDHLSDHLSPILTDCTLSLADPHNTNRALQTCITFATASSHSQTNPHFFPEFVRTLVSGKDATAKQPLPSAYHDILSLLSDATTLRSPSLPAQTYSPRHRAGHFTLAHLRDRSWGRHFQGLKKAFAAALLYRRLAWTAAGHLALIPRYAQPGDRLCVIPGVPTPFLVRARADGAFILVGECYVDQYMHGSIGRDESLPWAWITVA